MNFGVQRTANGFLLPRALQRSQHLTAHLEQSLPGSALGGRQPGIQFLFGGQQCQVDAFLFVSVVRQGAPNLLGGKGENRSQQAGQGMGDAVQGRLRRAPRGRPGRKSVEPILEDVEVGSAQIHHAEIVQAMPGAMKGVAVVGGAAVLHHFTHLRQHPAVQFFHLLALDRIGARVEVRQIAQAETKRVAHLSVAFHRLRQQARPDAHVGVIVHRRRHQTQNLRPVLLADFPRGDNIPQRL